MEGLWGGDDVLDELLGDHGGHNSHINFALRSEHRTSINRTGSSQVEADIGKLLMDNGDGPRVQLLGMMATGTNLLLALITRNLHARVLDKLDLGAGLFWKHSPLQQTLTGRIDNPAHFSKVAGLAIVRNPLALFSRYIGAGGQKNMCDKKWQNLSPRVLKEHCGPAVTKAPQWDGGGTYRVQAANISALWNNYAKSYLDELSGLNFNHTLVLRYEDLLENPEGAVAKIATLLDLPPPTDVDFPEKAQGPSSHGTTRSQAHVEYRDRTYLRDFSKETLLVACENLDRELMRRLQYTDCEQEEDDHEDAV